MNKDALYSLLGTLRIGHIAVRGNNYMACCPYHQERKPSWGISLDEPHKHGCFSCGARGTLFDLLVKIGGYTPSRARQICGLRENPHELSEFDRTKPKTKTAIDETELYPFKWDKAAHLFAESRNLHIPMCKGLGLLHHHKDNRLLFPWRFNAKLVGVTGRAMDDNPAKTLPYFGTKKGEWLYLPLGKLRKGRFQLVEGEIDSIKILQSGWENVGAIGFGRFTDAQADLILKAGVTELVTFFDDDDTGRLLREVVVTKLGNKIPVAQVAYAPWRKLYKGKKLDPGEMSCEHIDAALSKVKRFSAWRGF